MYQYSVISIKKCSRSLCFFTIFCGIKTILLYTTKSIRDLCLWRGDMRCQGIAGICIGKSHRLNLGAKMNKIFQSHSCCFGQLDLPLDFPMTLISCSTIGKSNCKTNGQWQVQWHHSDWKIILILAQRFNLCDFPTQV